MIKYLIVFLINFCFLFDVKAEVLPNWYKNTENTKLYIYGIGKGNNLENAKKNALNNIRKKFLRNKNKSIVNINLLNFPNYEIEKQEVVNDIFYILLAIRKSEIYSLQLQQLKEIVLNIENLYNSLNNKNDFVKFIKFEKILQLLTEMNNKIKIIKLIDNKFNDSKYNLLYKRIENKYIDVLNSLNVKIKIEQKRIEELQSIVIDNIKENNFIEINNKSKNTLYLFYKVKMMNVDNNYNVDILFYSKILDKNNNLINYNSFNYNFCSNNSFTDAIKTIMENFKEDLKSGKIKIIDFALKK